MEHAETASTCGIHIYSVEFSVLMHSRSSNVKKYTLYTFLDYLTEVHPPSKILKSAETLNNHTPGCECRQCNISIFLNHVESTV